MLPELSNTASVALFFVGAEKPTYNSNTTILETLIFRGVWKSGNPESGIGTGIGTGTGTGTGIGTGMGRETYIKAGTTFTLI